MFLFQVIQKNVSAVPDKLFVSKETVERGKVIANIQHATIMTMPDKLLNEITGGYAKSLKCLVHYMNASGKPLKLNFSAKEWKYIIDQTKIDVFEEVRNKGDVMRPNIMKSGIDSNNLLEGGYYGPIRCTLPELDMMKKEGVDSDKILRQMKSGEERIIQIKGMGFYIFKKESRMPPHGSFVGFLYPDGTFMDKMKDEGIDIFGIEREMKPNDVRELTNKSGKPYLIKKYPYDDISYLGRKSESNSHDQNGYLVVYYDRKWQTSKDGWQRMRMVPGGNPPNFLAEKTDNLDSWSVLGFTMVARKPRAEGGWDYKIEETFDFVSGKLSPNDHRTLDFKYRRVLPDALALLFKATYPKVVFVDPCPNSKGYSIVSVDSDWLNHIGKPFKLDISCVVDSKGKITPNK